MILHLNVFRNFCTTHKSPTFQVEQNFTSTINILFWFQLVKSLISQPLKFLSGPDRKNDRIPTAANGKITSDSGWLELEMMEINLSATAVFTVSDSINVRKFMVPQTSVQLLFSGRSFAATFQLWINMKSWLQQHDCFWLRQPRLGHSRTSATWFCLHWCSSKMNSDGSPGPTVASGQFRWRCFQMSNHEIKTKGMRLLQLAR